MALPDLSKTVLIGSEWQEAIAPTVKTMRLAGMIGQNYTLNSKGALAMAKLIEDMAQKLDIADAYIKELSKKGD